MQLTAPDHDAQNASFVEALQKLCHDRGHRAELRRYWSERTRHYAWPVLGHLRALDDERKMLLAALYATHEREGAPAHAAEGPSVGKAFLQLAGGHGNAEGFDSAERHFRRLLACETFDELAGQLQRLVKRLERKGIPLDYVRLLRDLRFWRNNAERVKTDWALDFWQAADEPQPEAEDAA